MDRTGLLFAFKKRIRMFLYDMLYSQLPIHSDRSTSSDKFLYSAVSSGLHKALYALLPGRPVQLNTVSTSLGNIQPHCN